MDRQAHAKLLGQRNDLAQEAREVVVQPVCGDVAIAIQDPS
jgi:hypothetical protein